MISKTSTLWVFTGLFIKSGKSFVPVASSQESTTPSNTYSLVSLGVAGDTSATQEEVVDVVVVGSGIGGLSCASMSALYGLDTVCLEAHDTAGGVAHSFTRFSSASKTTPFRFDSGPSLMSGLSSKSTNPLRQVLDAIGTSNEIDWKSYDGWVVHDNADNTSFKLTTGTSGAFEVALEKKAGKQSRREFESFKEKMMEPGGLSEASTRIPPLALRGDIGAISTMSRYFLKLLQTGTKGTLLTGDFGKVMDKYHVKDEFVRKWFDYISFALSGLDAAHTQAAPVAYMMIDLHGEGAVLDYPMGGMESLIQALVSGLEKHGGELRLNSRVESFILDEDKGSVEGVVLSNGRKIKARRGVVCNAPLWNMARMLSDSVADPKSRVQSTVAAVCKQANEMCMTRSFMHLHLGIPRDGLPDDIECHHSVLDFSEDVTAEQNMVILSIPTAFDPSLAPDGYHIVHAYSAACDDFQQWERFLHNGESGKVGYPPNSSQASSYGKTAEYRALRKEKQQILWKAIEKVIPDVRERATRTGSVVLSGTPLTHRRYNQRYRGTYGPANNPDKDVWDLPGAQTSLSGLLACGDTTFPGIVMKMFLLHKLTHFFTTKASGSPE